MVVRNVVAAAAPEADEVEADAEDEETIVDVIATEADRPLRPTFPMN
jgi:hypothetical protein